MHPFNHCTFPALREPAPAGDSLFVLAYRLLRVWRRGAKRTLASCASKQV